MRDINSASCLRASWSSWSSRTCRRERQPREGWRSWTTRNKGRHRQKPAFIVVVIIINWLNLLNICIGFAVSELSQCINKKQKLLKVSRCLQCNVFLMSLCYKPVLHPFSVIIGGFPGIKGDKGHPGEKLHFYNRCAASKEYSQLIDKRLIQHTIKIFCFQKKY